MRSRSILILLVASLVAAIVALGIGAASAPAADENAVVAWSRISEPIISAGRPPASSEVLAGLVHAAMYDAVAAAEGGLQPFLVSPQVTRPADSSAAVATAAYGVLLSRVGAAATGPYNAYMLSIPDGEAKENGIALGSAVADALLELRKNDGFGNAVSYVQQPVGPGVWEPTATTPPVDTKLTQVQPFTFPATSFRGNGPQSLKSGEYAKDVEEVRQYGGNGTTTATLRNAEQTETAQFWAENTYIQWSRSVRELAGARGLDLRDSARLLGLVHVSTADAMTACFEAKYHFSYWRPVHAIRRAGEDGNPHTTADPDWTSLMAVNHPEYPSGHSCFTGAIVEAIQAFFKTDKVELTISTTVASGGSPRTYARLGEIVDDVTNARIWSGLHFRNTMEESDKLGRKVVQHVAPKHFRETPGK